MTKKFRIYFINFEYYSADEFDTLEAAKAHAKSKSFQSAIIQGDTMVATWCPISGFTDYV